jgi:hypothetical protein
MPVKKRVLLPNRRRHLPSGGWSWIDRRFLREYVDSLERDAVLLYFFLTAVADKHGLSYYSDLAIGSRLRFAATAVANARDELLARDLIAYDAPLYQVLSLPEPQPRCAPAHPQALGDIMLELAARASRRRETDNGGQSV